MKLAKKSKMYLERKKDPKSQIFLKFFVHTCCIQRMLFKFGVIILSVWKKVLEKTEIFELKSQFYT